MELFPYNGKWIEEKIAFGEAYLAFLAATFDGENAVYGGHIQTPEHIHLALAREE